MSVTDRRPTEASRDSNHPLHDEAELEQLRRDEALFRAMVDHSPLNIITADADLIITYMNDNSFKTLKRVERELPCRVEDVIGQSIDIFHKDPERQHRILSNPRNLPHQADIKLGDEILNLYVTELIDEQGRRLGTMVTWDIVTEKNRLKNDVAGQLAAINKSQAVIEFEMDGTIISANEKFLKAMGYTLEEIRGRHHSMFVDPELRGSAQYREFWEKLNRGDYVSGEYRRFGKDGREIWIEGSYNPILDPNGKPFKVVKYADDITQRVRLEQAAERQRIKTSELIQELIESANQFAEGARVIAESRRELE